MALGASTVKFSWCGRQLGFQLTPVHERKNTALVAECCFTSTETVGLLGTGAQDGHLDFHTAPEF